MARVTVAEPIQCKHGATGAKLPERVPDACIEVSGANHTSPDELVCFRKQHRILRSTSSMLLRLLRRRVACRQHVLRVASTGGIWYRCVVLLLLSCHRGVVLVRNRWIASRQVGHAFHVHALNDGGQETSLVVDFAHVALCKLVQRLQRHLLATARQLLQHLRIQL